MPQAKSLEMFQRAAKLVGALTLTKDSKVFMAIDQFEIAAIGGSMVARSGLAGLEWECGATKAER